MSTLQAKAQTSSGWNISISLNMSCVTEGKMWCHGLEMGQATGYIAGIRVWSSKACAEVLKSKLLLLEAEQASLKLV